jgi:hypothetical protein
MHYEGNNSVTEGTTIVISNGRYYSRREQQSREGNNSCSVQMNNNCTQREQQSHKGNDSCSNNNCTQREHQSHKGNDNCFVRMNNNCTQREQQSLFRSMNNNPNFSPSN